jgi:hypothetical protein
LALAKERLRADLSPLHSSERVAYVIVLAGMGNLREVASSACHIGGSPYGDHSISLTVLSQDRRLAWAAHPDSRLARHSLNLARLG